MARTSASAHMLTDHDEIQRWAEQRGGQPACVRGTGGANDVGMVRIDFPGYSGEGSLEPISWDEWFEKFDERKLGLLVQDTTARGQKSNFNKLVSRSSAVRANGGAGRQQGRSRTARTSTSSRRRASTASRRRSRAGRSTETVRGRRAAKGRSVRGRRSATRTAEAGRSGSQSRARRSVKARGRRTSAAITSRRDNRSSRRTGSRRAEPRSARSSRGNRRTASVRSISSGRKTSSTRGNRGSSRRRAA